MQGVTRILGSTMYGVAHEAAPPPPSLSSPITRWQDARNIASHLTKNIPEIENAVVVRADEAVLVVDCLQDETTTYGVTLPGFTSHAHVLDACGQAGKDVGLSLSSIAFHGLSTAVILCEREEVIHDLA